jgi:hypothetical protein
MDMYQHVRVLFTIILGLGVSRLLSGLARIVQHPREYKVYWVHLLWALFLFLYLLLFWWWEFRLQAVQQWTFPLYFFIAIYAVLQYLLCVLLFPEEMGDYDSFKEYFYSRRQWIFSLMTVLFMADIADTLVKGGAYLHALGPVYYARTGSCILLSAASIKVKDERFHAGFAIYATAYEIALIFKYYMTIG